MSRKVAGLRKTVAKEAKVEDELFWNTLPKPNLHPLFEPTDPPEVKGFKEDRRRSQGFGDGEGPEVLDVKARSRRKTFVFALVFLFVAAAGIGGCLVYDRSFSGSGDRSWDLPAPASLAAQSEGFPITVEVGVLLNWESMANKTSSVSSAMASLTQALLSTLDSHFIVLEGNEGKSAEVAYVLRFSTNASAGAPSHLAGVAQDAITLSSCNASTPDEAQPLQSEIVLVAVSNATNISEAAVGIEAFVELGSGTGFAGYCARKEEEESGDSAAKARDYFLIDLESRVSVGIRAAHNNTDPYVLEDKLLMAFESEALQASLAEGDVIQSLNVSALATPVNGTGISILSGLPLTKENQGSRYDDLYGEYIGEVEGGGGDNANTTAPDEVPAPTPDSAPAPAPTPDSVPAPDPTPSPAPAPPEEVKEANTSDPSKCEAKTPESVPYATEFLDFVRAMTAKNEILDTISNATGKESILLNDALALDWTKPKCAITNHTYYPSILSFGGVGESGLFSQELTCGQQYRKYDSQSGIISSVLDTDLIAYFYEDGYLEALWTSATDWVYYDRGEVMYTYPYESNLTLWTMYEDDQKIQEASRSITPRWANVMPCQYYKNLTQCISKANQMPLKLALVVLHWNDTDPNTIDMDLMQKLYANEMIEKYWESQSYGLFKKIEFETFGPVNTNINEFYNIGGPQDEIKFCAGEKASSGVLVREGGGCGTRGCTYISPNVVAGLYSNFEMTTNIFCIPGWRPENFFGTIFLTYSSKGCGGAGLFNSVFNIWINGKKETLRAISMSHMGPHERCDASGNSCTFVDHTIGNVEPRHINQTQPPDTWEHPLKEANLVQTHELIHLFGISWHSSARKCSSDATDFRKCDHREYGNEFSLVGGSGAALELPAHERYNLHFLQTDDVVVIKESGSFQIGPISSALPATHRAALLVDGDETVWLEVRRPVGYDTSLGWAEYERNTRGLMATCSNHLIDLNRNDPDESTSLYSVTLNSGYEWKLFGTKITVSNIVSMGNEGLSFEVAFGTTFHSSSYGVRLA